jgi:hypothetical protein
VKDENGDLHADSHNVLNRWKNYVSLLLNVHGVSDDRQTKIHTTEPLVPSPSHLWGRNCYWEVGKVKK